MILAVREQVKVGIKRKQDEESFEETQMRTEREEGAKERRLERAREWKRKNDENEARKVAEKEEERRLAEEEAQEFEELRTGALLDLETVFKYNRRQNRK